MLNTSEQLILKAAVDDVNVWLASVMTRPDLKLRLVTQGSVSADFRNFTAGVGKHRKVKHWDWVQLFHQRVKFRNAWMFAVDGPRRRPGPRAMSWGKVEVVAPGYVSIEYLERRPFARMGGLTTLIAFRFVQIVGLALGVAEVRVSEPFPQLIPYYVAKLGVIRHPATGRVQYLFKTIP